MRRNNQTQKLIKAVKAGRQTIAIDTNHDMGFVYQMLEPHRQERKIAVTLMYNGIEEPTLRNMLRSIALDREMSDVIHYRDIIVYSSYLLGQTEGGREIIRGILALADVAIDGEIDWEKVHSTLKDSDFEPKEPAYLPARKALKA